MQPRYAVPILTLSALTAAFFLARRFRPLPPRLALGLRIAAAAPLVVSGTLHLARPQTYLSLIPPSLPQQAWFIVVTGLPELLGAVGLFLPSIRRTAAICLSLFMIAIFPANVYVAGHTVHGIPMPTVPVRATMQAAYILLLLIAGWGLPTRDR